MTRRSEREIERQLKSIDVEGGGGEFVRQCVAVLNGDRDAVDASLPSDPDGVELALQVSDAAGVSTADA